MEEIGFGFGCLGVGVGESKALLGVHGSTHTHLSITLNSNFIITNK